jgi:hypothetical protein
MGMFASFGLTEPLRSDRPAHYWCSCGIEFEAPTHEGAVRMQEAHAAEMRHPEAHEGCVF